MSNHQRMELIRVPPPQAKGLHRGLVISCASIISLFLCSAILIALEPPSSSQTHPTFSSLETAHTPAPAFTQALPSYDNAHEVRRLMNRAPEQSSPPAWTRWLKTQLDQLEQTDEAIEKATQQMKSNPSH